MAKKTSKARRYYVVEQVQDGLWYQVGYYFAKTDAERARTSLSGRTRIVRTFPGHSYPAR